MNDRPFQFPRRSTLRLGTVTLTLMLALSVPTSTQSSSRFADSQARLPKVRVLTTGGTIASRQGKGPLTAEELVASAPDLGGITEISVEQFVTLASERITPSHWLALTQRITTVLAGDVDGVVVTHGTDTLEETAYFLTLTVHSEKPVVVVGSMRGSDAVSADGPANLVNAARVAASPEARGRGVLVVLNDEIHCARDVTKTNTLRLDTFRSRTFGPLGTIDRGHVTFHRRDERRHGPDTPFDVSQLAVTDLPRVDIVYVYAGADGTALDANVDHGAKGIVIAAVGAGGVTPAQREAVQRALAKHVVVVIASRTGSGAIADAPPNTIRGDDLLPQKARVLLMLALTRTSDLHEIQRMFETF